jgi:hypothetical protein
METMMPKNIPSEFIFFLGIIQLIQLFVFIWIIVFPVIIIKKLNEIVELLKRK